MSTYSRICQICGKQFDSKSPQRKICYEDHYQACDTCGETILWNKLTQCRCKSCTWKIAADKRKKTMTEKYGAPTTLQSTELRRKMSKTCIEKYGVDNPMKCDAINAKARRTNLDRYGVENPMSNPDIAKRSAAARMKRIDEILDKSRKACLDHYGLDNPAKCSQVIDRLTDTVLQRYGVKRAVHVSEFRDKMINTMLDRYGVSYYVQSPDYLSKSHTRISDINKKFGQKLTDLGVEFEYEFPLQGKFYDICIPQSNILIEIDPTYTHNVIGNHWNQQGVDANYHRDKTRLANEHGYRCIHVFDWDNWDKVLDLIKPSDRVLYARNCRLYKLNPKVGDEFLNKYHLQGTCRGQLLYLGLVHEGELVQVMTFGKSRYSSKHYVELLRMCTKPGCTVVGGASKLFTFATRDTCLHSIISYCDLSKFSGNVYEKIGMKLIRKTPPQEIWSRENEKITANLLRQRGFDQLFGTNHGKGSSNEKLMIEHGWLPVYDCGQAVYEFE